jgi:hypothetical protein
VIVVCAWCNSILGEKDGRGLTGITSGICDECFAKISTEPPPGLARGARDAEGNRDPVVASPPERRRATSP